MGQITYKDIFQLVREQIDSRIKYRDSVTFRNQLDTTPLTTDLPNSLSDIGANALVSSVQTVLQEALPGFIISGLEVEATTPASRYITIRAGKGSKGGLLYELTDDITVPVPLDATTDIFIVSLYRDNVIIQKQLETSALPLAKIVIPFPGKIFNVYDKKIDRVSTWDAYIVSFQEFKLYADRFGDLEEDSIEFLRNNIGQILADNIIGNIRLSENLKISNTQGSLTLDSNSLKIYSTEDKLLAKFDQNGISYYDSTKKEVARFGRESAKVGNILITPTSLQSVNFSSGANGFQIKDDGNVEFNNATLRGTLYATAGLIGGWTIAANKIYATTTGTIQTSASVGAGSNGVILDKDGIRVYDDILGLVVNLPSDGSAPSFSSGTITEVTFEIQTNTVIRTSETVGDGTSASAGILINSTGIYGLGANQIPSTANLRVLSNGNIYLKGEIQAESGVIGGFTIDADKLVGGTIIGATLIGGILTTSSTLPRIRIDSNGVYYQVTESIGKYGTFKYGHGTSYGSGNTAVLFNSAYPIFSVLQESQMADIRLYNRGSDPTFPSGTSGSNELGDLICVNSIYRICKLAGTPGTFEALISSDNTTGGTGDAGAGKQYVNVNINGTIYKLLYTT